jgi:hypothetical protein
MVSLVSNLGGKIDAIVDWQSDPKDLTKNQEIAWYLVRRSIDEGKPCYGFGFLVPEYYVAYGYDDTGYYVSGSGCDSGTGPVPWNMLGKTDIGLIDIHSVSPAPVAEDAKTVRDAVEFTLELAQNPNKWIVSNYQSGLAGYDLWIKSVGDGTLNALGMAYNAAVWSECRAFSVQFLIEAGRRLSGPAVKPLEEAAEHYEVVARRLHTISQLFPMPAGKQVEDKTLRKKAATLLQNARDAEAYGLASLEKVVSALS